MKISYYFSSSVLVIIFLCANLTCFSQDKEITNSKLPPQFYFSHNKQSKMFMTAKDIGFKYMLTENAVRQLFADSIIINGNTWIVDYKNPKIYFALKEIPEILEVVNDCIAKKKKNTDKFADNYNTYFDNLNKENKISCSTVASLIKLVKKYLATPNDNEGGDFEGVTKDNSPSPKEAIADEIFRVLKYLFQNDVLAASKSMEKTEAYIVRLQAEEAADKKEYLWKYGLDLDQDQFDIFDKKFSEMHTWNLIKAKKIKNDLIAGKNSSKIDSTYYRIFTNEKFKLSFPIPVNMKESQNRVDNDGKYFLDFEDGDSKNNIGMWTTLEVIPQNQEIKSQSNYKDVKSQCSDLKIKLLKDRNVTLLTPSVDFKNNKGLNLCFTWLLIAGEAVYSKEGFGQSGEGPEINTVILNYWNENYFYRFKFKAADNGSYEYYDPIIDYILNNIEIKD